MKEKRPSLTKGELNRLVNINSPDIPQTIEVGGARKRWTGVGWVDEGKPKGDEVLIKG